MILLAEDSKNIREYCRDELEDDGRIRLATACVEKTADLTELKQAIASAGLGYEVDRR
jgi:hypothetical protein